MKTIPYRCDELKHKALLGAALSSGISMQKLFDNFVPHVLAERQAEARFFARQKLATQPGAASFLRRFAREWNRMASPRKADSQARH